MIYNTEGEIYTSKGTKLNKADSFDYLGSNISSSEKDVRIALVSNT